jgi:hypothetical protein
MLDDPTKRSAEAVQPNGRLVRLVLSLIDAFDRR